MAIAVGVPIEIEAALSRLYPESEEAEEGGAPFGEIVSDGEPTEEDTERLKDLASEAPVIRLVNQLIAQIAAQVGSRSAPIVTPIWNILPKVQCLEPISGRVLRRC